MDMIAHNVRFPELCKLIYEGMKSCGFYGLETATRSSNSWPR